ncbi:MAG TPA: type II toxin-antitoxin system VapC family toxin [Thermoanaerobaculia bacterium]
MGPRVYVETTIISYLVGRLNRRDVHVASNQVCTRQWWNERRQAFQLYASAIVLQEITAGKPEMAAARLQYLDGISFLDVDAAAEQLKDEILRKSGVPRKAEVDALHIAIAAVNGMDYLISWNCKHIVNAVTLPKVYAVCRHSGFEPPFVCTPAELMEG